MSKASSKQTYISILVFLVSFSFPIALIYLWNHQGGDQPVVELVEQISSTNFSQEIKIANQGEYLELVSDNSLLPITNKDFIFLGWFRLAQIPKTDEKVHLMSYFDNQLKGRPGYALMIRRDIDAMRAAVYWNADSEKSRWYSFSKFTIFPKEWFYLVISFTDNKYLGLHIGSINQSGTYVTKTLGGYEVPPLSSTSNPNLMVGSIGSGNFKGKIGPLVVANLEQGADAVTDVLESAVSVERLSSVVAEEDRTLWLTEGLESELGNGAELRFKKYKKKLQ